MAIRRMELHNFKSFRHLEVELGPLEVIIGANAAGKSSFIQAFRFLRDIEQFGLDNAISLQGGVEYLRNIQLGSSEDFSLDVDLDLASEFLFPMMAGPGREIVTKFAIERARYGFSLAFSPDDRGYEVVRDQLSFHCHIVSSEVEVGEVQEEESVDGEITITRRNGENHIDFAFGEADEMAPSSILSFLFQGDTAPDSLLCERSFPPILSRRLFSSLGIYDLDPKGPKETVKITGKAELEEDGSNLAIALQRVLEDPDQGRRFTHLIRDLLPFVQNLTTEQFGDKSLTLKLHETYFPGQAIPASWLSDGTLQIAALILALYFEDRQMIVVEEPEKSIHPHLISRMVDMLEDASRVRQILVTTHNPEVVKHAQMDRILLMSRDEDGFSRLVRPGEMEEVKVFLAGEMGLDELYVQNLLGL